ncbi:MAG: CRISPR system precrRNA processing endoribonuclease RAMP protein Cas6 [Betaproteobacteria bacterium]|nr:CRISPR system precrRNA processing endoribonuclease RAMP protein Cas6 [Betaproteobacteria bacterium]
MGCYRLKFGSDEPLRFSNFPGSAWRGALGHSLARLACVSGMRGCPPCRRPQACAYGYLFETAPPPGAAKMRKYNQVPHPFALRLEATAERACTLRVHLFGRANGYLPIVVAALRQAGQSWDGIAHNRLALEAVLQESAPGSGEWRRIDDPAGALLPLAPAAPVTPACPAGVEVRLLTPLRAKGEGRPKAKAALDFGAFFSVLLRRISMLTYFHGEVALEADFKSLVAAARAVHAEMSLHWREQLRYSARQKTEMKLGGVIGSMRIEGQDLTPFWPFLWLGQWTHAGAAASMGNGAYELASLPSLHAGWARDTLATTPP